MMNAIKAWAKALDMATKKFEAQGHGWLEAAILAEAEPEVVRLKAIADGVPFNEAEARVAIRSGFGG
jgi:hypothetical protein